METLGTKALVIYPTDTVWGLGAYIGDEQGQNKVRQLKGNEPHKPLSVLFSSRAQLDDYFSLPSQWSGPWLQDLFAMQVTLCVPRVWNRKRKIPSFVYGDATHVGIRCLTLPWLEELTEHVGGPVTSTSLNLTKDPPIVDRDQARKFWQDHCPKAHFVSGPETFHPSGEASSIIMVHLDQGIQFSTLRAGKKLALVERHLSLAQEGPL